ncbi:MAG: class I SAM-dependent methyltransferase [Candidatus Omnitrophica bacterium]|nr:class I SAM-dependent methyltransferase [Candidatus Omnitrophota bacterium]
MSGEKRDFDKEAASWDAGPRLKLAEDIFKVIVKQIEPSLDMDVLDFGCGTGLVAFPLSRLVSSVTGVDTSKGMLEVFDNKVKNEQIDNVKTLYLDLTEKDMVHGKYHAIISSMTLHHIEDTKKILEHFYRVLLPGGKIAIADLDTEEGNFHDSNEGIFHFGFDRKKLGRLFKEIGFTNINFTRAAKMKKICLDGKERTFDIFMITCKKKLKHKSYRKEAL